MEQKPCFTVVDSFSDDAVTQALAHAGPKTLVIYDIDFVLTYPDDPLVLLLSSNDDRFAPQDRDVVATMRSEFFERVHQKYCQYVEPNPWKFYGLKIIKYGYTCLIEPRIVHIIKDLQKRNIKIIALTSSSLGKFGEMVRSTICYESLKALGIDFSSSFALDSEVRFLPTGTCDEAFQAFYKGIFFTCRNAKGDALRSFLLYIYETFKWLPDNIIFFDDHQENLLSVVGCMNAASITCDAFLYQGARERYVVFDQKLMEQRLSALEDLRWLSRDGVHGDEPRLDDSEFKKA
jgi:hypothetical protein